MKTTIRTLTSITLGLLAIHSACGTPRTWNGGGTDNNWSTAANWGGIAPAVNNDNLIFSGTLRQNNTNNYTGITNVGLAFSSGGWVLNGNPVTQGANITNTSGTNIINNNLVFTATRTVNVAADQLTLNGVISGTGATFGLTKSGVGTLVLTATNTYTGTNTVASGTGIVKITNPHALGTGRVTLSRGGNNTGTLQIETQGANTITNTFNGFSSGNFGAGVPATIENLSGTNTLTSNLRVTGLGGSGLCVYASGGLLKLNGVLDTSITFRGVGLNGAGNGEVNGPITDGTTNNNAFGIFKDGIGTWTLNGTNTHTGGTTVRAGTLALGATGSISNTPFVRVYAGATLDVSAQAGGWPMQPAQALDGNGAVQGNVVAGTSSVLRPSANAAVNTVGTLTINGNLSMTSATNFFNLSSDPTGVLTPNDVIQVNGNLSAAGVNIVWLENYVNGFIPNGTYQLIKFTGSLTGNASNFDVTNFTVGARGVQGGYIVASPNSIDLVVTGTPPAVLTWTGDGAGNNWDINTSSNWLNGIVTDVFYDSDAVTFDNTAINRTVNFGVAVQPSAVVINSTNDYSFENLGGKITGATGLTKLGSGNLTNTVSHDYTGVTRYGGGKFSVPSIGIGGVASPVGAAPNSVSWQVLDGGILEYTGPGESNNRQFTVGTNGGGISVADPNATLAFTNNGPIAASGNTFTKYGPGTLQYNDQATLTGTNFILGGVLRIPQVGLFGTERTIPVYIDGGALNLNGQTMADKPVVAKGMGDLTLGVTNGAIINLGASQSQALRFVTLTGDTAFGGTGRWDIRANPTATLSTGGNAYNLIKVGANQIRLAGVTVDPALANIEVREGTLGYELGTTGLGNPASTLTIRANASFLLAGSTVPLNKQIVLDDFATLTNASGAPAISGPVSMTGDAFSGPTIGVASGTTLNLSGVVSGLGNLAKQGAGTLNLTGTNTYSSQTTISAGKLVFSSVHAGGGDITVDDSTGSPALGVTAVGASQVKPNNLTFGSGINPVACEFNNLSSTTTAPLRATNLTVSSTVTVNINSGVFLAGQTYPLITFDTAGGAGSFVLGTLPPLVAGNLVTNGSTIGFSVTSAVNIETWTGAVNANWDIGTTTNWLFNSAPAVFVNGFGTQFDDSGSNTAITVTTTVSPANMIVNNSSKAYSFTGSPIAGSGSLLKQGTGELNLSSANTYGGGTTLSAGTLNLNASGAIGAGAFTIEGGTLNNIGGSPTTLTANNPQNWNGNFAFVGTQDINLGTGTVTLGTNITVNATGGTLTVGGALSDGGAGFNLTKSGAGALTLGAANNYGGNTTINAGTLKATANGALPATTAVGFTSATTATLDLQSSAQVVSNLVFGNSGTSTITIGGINGSALNVSPAVLTFAPATTVNNLTVNMADLGTFRYTNETGVLSVRNGSGASTSSGQTTLTLAGGTNVISASTLNVGNQSSSSGVIASTLNLGQNNTLSVDSINLGSGRAGGRLQFAAGLTNPVLNLTGVSGPGSAADVTFGGHDSFTAAATDSPVDWFDTSAGTLNAELNSVTVGRVAPPSNITGNRGITVTASFRMGGGTLSAASMTLGLVNAATGNSGSFNYNFTNRALLSLANGGTATITNLTLANSLYDGNLAASTLLAATVSLTNGGTLRSTLIQRGTIATPSAGSLTVQSQVLWDDGTVGNILGDNLTISDVDLVLADAPGARALDITAGQNGTVNSVISGAGSLTKAGAGLLTLTNANTYTGSTLVNGGTLALASTATLASTNISVAGGATFDSSGLGGPLVLTGQSLGNSTSTGLVNGSVDASSGALALNYAAGTPSLSVGNGALTLAASTAATVNNTGAALGNGSYKLIAAGAGGSVAGTAPSSVTVTGNGLGSGGSASLNITGGELFLNVIGVGPSVNTNPTNIVSSVSGTNLNLSWPSDRTGWRLLVQTNSRSVGLVAATNAWSTWPGSAATNAVSIPISPANPTVFFRLVYP